MSISILNDFLHLVAAVAWIGGMIYANLVLVPSLAAIEPPQRPKMMGAAAKRFILISWGSVVVLIVTGLIETPPGALLDLSTDFSTLLALKHAVVLLMIIIGIAITWVLSPRMTARAPQEGEKPSSEFLKVQNRLSVLALVNMMLGILVLFFSAAL